MWKEIENTEVGICPKCNSEDISYGASEFEGEGGVVYPFTCNGCGFAGREWYNLVFSGIWEETE